MARTYEDLVGEIVEINDEGVRQAKVASVEWGPRVGFRSAAVDFPGYDNGKLNWCGRHQRIRASEIKRILWFGRLLTLAEWFGPDMSLPVETPAMAYKTNNTGNDDGTYTLSYGKASKKLSALMRNHQGKWETFSGDGPRIEDKTMKAVKERWGAWAESNYEGTPKPPAQPPTVKAPPAPPVKGPPAMKGPPSMPPKGPPTFKPSPTKVTPEVDAAAAKGLGSAEFAADPFDPVFHHPDKSLNSIGALDEVYNWACRNSHRVLYPGSNAVLPPFDTVIRVLRRETKRPYPDPQPRQS